MRSFDCDLYLDLMPLVKDGAASAASREALELHMQQCPSCREAYALLPETPAPETSPDGALKRIKKRLTAIISGLLLFGTMLGASLTMTGSMGYNLLLFPIMGAIAYALRGKQCWRIALDVSVFCFIWMLVSNLGDLRWALVGKSILYPLCYGLACLLGALIAYLIHQIIRKKFAKGIAGLALLAAILYGGSLFFGNPISYEAVRANTNAYLDEEYPELDMGIADIYYDWYNGGYYKVYVASRVSLDTYFELHYNQLGQQTWSSYESWVASGDSTFYRLDDDYSTRIRGALHDPERFQYHDLVDSVTLVSDHYLKTYDEALNYPFYPEEILDTTSLSIDGEYDRDALGAQYGKINIWGSVDDVSEETICQILLELKQTIEKYKFTAATVDVAIFDSADNKLQLAGFRFDDIGSDNMEQLVHEACLAWDEFQIRYDAYIEELNKDR